MMEMIMQDIRYGFRMLLKNPGFTAVAVIALTLGIGANTAIFSVVNAVLFSKLPYGDPDRVMVVWETNPNLVSPEWRIRSEVSPGNFFDWRDQNQVFEQLAAFRIQSYSLTGGDIPEQLMGNAVTANMLSTLRVKPELGRDFLAEEEVPGANRVVILSHGLWQRRFGSNPGILDQTIQLNDQSYIVVGIMPANFEFPPGNPELFVPLAFDPQQRNSRTPSFLYTRARLKPGVEVEQAQSEMNLIATRLREQHPDANRDKGARVVSLQGEMVSSIKPYLIMLFAAVGFVLLIACANVANLLLARAASRQKEIAIRNALGADRRRIVSQLLTESILLSLVGGACGLLLAYWGVDILRASVPETLVRGIHSWDKIKVDGLVLGFTMVASVLTGIIFGLAPTIQASKTDLAEALSEGGRRTSGGGRKGLRGALVVSEVTLALVLLVGAGLMLKSFFLLLDVNPGFDAQNLITIRLSLPQARYSNNNQVTSFYSDLSQRVRNVPGVESVGVINNLPMSGSAGTTRFFIEGRPAPGNVKYDANYRIASPGYFDAMRIPILRGRDFTDKDFESQPPVVIINEAMARTYFPNEDPIGKRLLESEKKPPLEIIGIVGDVKHWGLDDKAQEYIYRALTQLPQRSTFLVVRSTSDTASMIGGLREQVRSVDKDLPISDVKPMQQRVADSSASRRLMTLLLCVFACIALLLAAAGIYGVMAYSVTQRFHEIGIRMALGARSVDILKLIVKQGMKMVLIGIALGLIASYLLKRVISSFLFGVSATDVLTFAGVSLLLIVVALVACCIPARNAMKVDPMEAVRYE
jgi:putative ABC transport system permease protein